MSAAWLGGFPSGLPEEVGCPIFASRFSTLRSKAISFTATEPGVAFAAASYHRAASASSASSVAVWANRSPRAAAPARPTCTPSRANQSGWAAAKGTQTPFVGLAATPGGQGYSVAGGFGKVYNFGEAPSEAFLIAPIDQC